MSNDEVFGDVEPAANGLGAPEGKPRLAVFGGSFDPPHNGHLQVAQQVIAQQLAQEVLFIPVGQPPHKDAAQLSSGGDRLAMVELAVEPYDMFSVSDIELINSQRPSYTLYSMQTLQQAFPGYELYFLLGMDSLAELHSWYRAGELVSRFKFLVYPRPGTTPPSYAELAGRLGRRNAMKLQNSLIDAAAVDISAREIRRRVQANLPIETLVPAPVAAYIDNHQLYKHK